jgi:hypothetical protein
MADHSLAPDRGQRNRFAIMKIVRINTPAQRAESIMSDLFDLSKEIILVTGASQGLLSVRRLNCATTKDKFRIQIAPKRPC